MFKENFLNQPLISSIFINVSLLVMCHCILTILISLKVFLLYIK